MHSLATAAGGTVPSASAIGCPVSPFLAHVAVVVGETAESQMLRINTGTDVARVHDDSPCGDVSEVQLVAVPMDGDAPSVPPTTSDDPIPGITDGPFPEPAAIRDANPREEAIDQGGANGRHV